MTTMQTAGMTLSQSQQEIYDLLQKGLTPGEIASTLRKDEGIVNAQITRMRTKGVLPPLDIKIQEAPRQPSPASTGPTSNDGVAKVISAAGPANYELPKELREIADMHGEVLDVHPMIMLGVAIQFVRLCGGRMHAHQVIEDVYGALRSMVGDAPDNKEHVTMPFPTVESERQQLATAERIKILEEQILSIKSRS